jgi:hypothetical protein
VLERVADELVADEAEFERVVGSVLDSPVVERAATQVLESRLPDTIVERLLESEELWLMVDEIAHTFGSAARRRTPLSGLARRSCGS